MAGTMFMRVEEVAKEMGVSIPYAYKLMRKLNKELQAGCIVLRLQEELTVNFFMKNSIQPNKTTKGAVKYGSI